MATQTNYVTVIAAWDNRQPLEDDVANQLINAITAHGSVFNAVAVTVTELVKATMNLPLGGTNQINVQLLSPVGTSVDDITAWVIAGVEALNLFTSPYLEVLSVEVN